GGASRKQRDEPDRPRAEHPDAIPHPGVRKPRGTKRHPKRLKQRTFHEGHRAGGRYPRRPGHPPVLGAGALDGRGCATAEVRAWGAPPIPAVLAPPTGVSRLNGDPGARLEADAFPNGLDDSRRFVAEHRGVYHLSRADSPFRVIMHVGSAYSNRPYFDEHFARSRLRNGPLLDFNSLRTSQ